MGYCIRCKKTVGATEKWVKVVGAFYHLNCYNQLVNRNKKIFIISAGILGLILITVVIILLIIL